MVAAVKYENCVEVSINEEVDWFGTTDTFRMVIHTDAPVPATDDQLADLTQVTGTGYAADGDDIGNDSTRTGGTVTVTAADHTWTATAGDWTQTGRYFSIHDDTSTSNELIQSYDYGAVIPIQNGETITADYGASLATWA
jgi:hypothetical protein